MSSIAELLKEYNTKISEKSVLEAVEKIITTEAIKNNNPAVYSTILNCIDQTSLNATDNEESIEALVEKVNEFNNIYPELPNVAAVCVYPSLVKTAKDLLLDNVAVASVAGGFPSSQTFIEVKIAETAMAVMEGADEIDIVISIGKYLAGDYETVAEEIAEIKSSCREAHLKVILETGTLKNPEDIMKASIIAMEAKADFIKTSTGKTEPAASLEAAYVMALAIKEFHEKTKKKVGIKLAGGIVTTQQAVNYYSIVKSVLGEEWLSNELFRIGASRLTNNLLSSITGAEVKYF